MSRVFDTGDQRRAVKAQMASMRLQPMIKYLKHPFSYVGTPKQDFVKFMASVPGVIRDFILDAPFVNPEDGVELTIQVVTKDGGYYLNKNSKEVGIGDGIVIDVGDKVVLSFPGKDSMPEEEVWVGFNFYAQL